MGHIGKFFEKIIKIKNWIKILKNKTKIQISSQPFPFYFNGFNWLCLMFEIWKQNIFYKISNVTIFSVTCQIVKIEMAVK